MRGVSSSNKVPQTIVSPRRHNLCGVLRNETNLKCLILTCLIAAALTGLTWCRMTTLTKIHINYDAFPITSEHETAACEELTFLLPASFILMLYALYLVECWHSNAWTMLRKPKDQVPETYAYLRKMYHALPRISWKASSYHYIRRTRVTSRTHQGHKIPTTQVYYERVTTCMEESSFYYGCCGVGDASPRLVGLEDHIVTKIRLTTAFLFANAYVEGEFQEQRSSFFQDHRRLDDYLEMHEAFTLLGPHRDEQYSPSIVTWSSPSALIGSRVAFWVASCLLLSWPFRLILALSTAHCQVQVTKLFGTNYVMTRPPPPQPTLAQPERPRLLLGRGDFLLEKDHNHNGIMGPLSRSVTLIKAGAMSPDGRNQFYLAPSYSQALLWTEEPPSYDQALRRVFPTTTDTCDSGSTSAIGVTPL